MEIFFSFSNASDSIANLSGTGVNTLSILSWDHGERTKYTWCKFNCSSAARTSARWPACTGSNVPHRIPILLADLAIPLDDVLGGGECTQPHGPSRMKFLRGDA